MTCNNVSRVMEPVRSRCLCVRVGAPPLTRVVELLHAVAKKEGLQLPSVSPECRCSPAPLSARVVVVGAAVAHRRVSVSVCVYRG